MGQERFADIVERFASGYRDGAASVPEPGPDTVRRWQEEIESLLGIGAVRDVEHAGLSPPLGAALI